VLDTTTDTTTPPVETTIPVVNTVTDTTAPALDTVIETTAPAASDTQASPAGPTPGAGSSPVLTTSEPASSATPAAQDEPATTTFSFSAMPRLQTSGGAALEPSREARSRDLSSSTGSAADRLLPASTAAMLAYYSSVLASTPSAHERAAPSTAPEQGPDQAPQAPTAPVGGCATASSGVSSSATFYAILTARTALALGQFGRLQLMPARWRCVEFIALLERPG
jgi:hypothetical protein